MIRWRRVLQEFVAVGKPMTVDTAFERLNNNAELVAELQWSRKAEDRKALRAALGVLIRTMQTRQGVLVRRCIGKTQSGHEVHEYYVPKEPVVIVPKKHAHISQRGNVVRRAPNFIPDSLDTRQRYENARKAAKPLPNGIYRLPDCLIRVSDNGVRTWRSL